MHTKKELLEILRLHNIRLKKRFGQNYLISPSLCQKLVNLCGLDREDTVIEIGSGIGALTGVTAAQVNKVIAIELDREICKALKERMSSFENIEFFCCDALDFKWSDYPQSIVIGAIPYNVASPIIATLCENLKYVKRVYLSLQIELARRLCALPSTKDYGRLSILVQYHFRPKLLLKIPNTVFFPQPEVDSSWVRLEPVSGMPVDEDLKGLFFDIVRITFSKRRKMLLNCICELKNPPLDKEKAKDIISASGFKPGVRAEELSIEDFAAITRLVSLRYS